MPAPLARSGSDSGSNYDRELLPAGDEATPSCLPSMVSSLSFLPSLVPSLPSLTDRATVYAGCCLALSTPLVAHLRSLLPKAPALTLSIGSGFGLLEALLLAGPARDWGQEERERGEREGDESPNTVVVVGVEVAPSSNTYLPATHHRTVHGSRFLDPLAAEANALLFVYPRRVALVSEYMAAHGCGNLHTIIWAGPHADWDDYKSCFAAGWEVRTQSAQEVGGKAWDLLAVAQRLPV